MMLSGKGRAMMINPGTKQRIGISELITAIMEFMHACELRGYELELALLKIHDIAEDDEAGEMKTIIDIINAVLVLEDEQS